MVNRRVVVDQATEEAEQIQKRLGEIDSTPALNSVRDNLRKLSLERETAAELIAISTLRGEKEDNRQWSDDPSRPAIIIGTVDMIGSRLLFSGYGNGRYWRAQHAGLLGQDALIVNDEAHLTPAFASLLSKIEDKQHLSLKPFRTIRLSATQGSSNCWPDSLEDDQKDEHFRKIYEAKKNLHIRDAGRQQSTLFELATEEGVARTLIFAQQPEKVKEISEKLAKKVGPEAAARILTLTGTMRGLERDRMTESPVFKAFANRQRPEQSYWLIATSAGEVGINISADRLIIELDTLDHLLQRFGRLNRFGETAGEAYVLISDASERDERKKLALDFLRKLDGRDDQTYDISPAALFGRKLPADACSEMPLQAELHDWLIDVWSQTSLGAHPARPQVEPWLHGKQENIPDTYVAWRKDVQYLANEEFDPEEREEVMQKYRLLAHEQLREPTTKLLTKLQELAQRQNPQGQNNDTKFLRRKVDGSVDVISLTNFVTLKNDAEKRRAIAKIAFCQLILPPGCGSIRDGMFSPESDPKSEIADENVVAKDETAIRYDVSGCKWDKELPAITTDETRASYRATRNEEDGTWNATRLGVAAEEKAPIDNLELECLHRFAADQGRRFLLKVSPESEVGESATALLYFGKARQNTGSAPTILIDKHNSDVAGWAKKFAECAGLSPDLILTLEKAGQLHDLGKQETIWQRAAGNVRPDDTLVKGSPVAKPIKVMRGRALGGFRHELASLRRAEGELQQDLVPELRDLVLHLIAAHHGHARPCFEKKAYDHNHLKKSECLALETAQRFARLQERYGPWGLAYLESILRAADGIASANSAAEEQPTNG